MDDESRDAAPDPATGGDARASPVFASRLVPGPRTVVGSQLLQSVLARADVEDKESAALLRSLGDLLPGRPVAAGAAATDRTLTSKGLAALVSSAAIVAAGLDPAAVTPPAPDVLWRSGAAQLRVRVSGVRVTLGDGLFELTVPVTCDQTGDTEATVTFVTGTQDRPAGGVVTTEDHPRGEAVIVENWAEPLIAFAWQTLVVATSAFSAAAGADTAGDTLITADLAISADAVTVTPMGRHVFLAGATRR